jgi:hypothetical protein
MLHFELNSLKLFINSMQLQLLFACEIMLGLKAVGSL